MKGMSRCSDRYGWQVWLVPALSWRVLSLRASSYTCFRNCRRSGSAFSV